MKINNLVTQWGLLLIIILASLLRLWQLGSNPPHLTPDEAALGYNAYSILRTGKDEYGQVLPMIFKSFGDYKPGLYVYSAVPFIGVFGLNEYSVRLPSAVAGITAVYVLFLIVKTLSDNKRLALISSMILAFLPWHIHFSRGAWEINLNLTLTLAGIYFFLKARKHHKWLLISAVFFALTLLAYQGAKLSTGIVLVILGSLYWKELVKISKKTLIGSVLLGIAISLPILFSFAAGQTGRLTVFSVFSYPRPEQYLQDFLDQGNEKIGSLSYAVYHPEWLNFTRGILGRYFNHFSGRFLFFEGDWQNPRHSSPYVGGLFLGQIVFIFMGVLATISGKFQRRHLFLWTWLILSPLPSVLSRDQVHAVRAYHMTIPLVLLIAEGVNYFLSDKRLSRKVLLLVLLPVIGLNLAYYLDSYFVHLPKQNSKYWEYGYKQIVETISPIQKNYSQVTIQQSYSQPYIYFLFYQKYDPVKYQAQAKLTESSTGDVGQVQQLDNICFCAIDWSRNRGDKGTLIVADTLRIPPGDSNDEREFRLIKKIDYLNEHETAFRIIEIKP